MTKYGIPMFASSGFTAEIDENLCIACGECAEAYPFDALYVDGVATLDWEKCMGCGVCVEKCTENAISLRRDERKGMPLDVRALDATKV